MKTTNLYKYERADGGVTVSPNKPNGEYTEKLRLVADNGNVLTNNGGKTVYKVIDVNSSDGWIEIEDTNVDA